MLLSILILQVSEDGNASTSVLSITPTREDHGKALSCRATNELVRNGIRETAMKLNVFCKYLEELLTLISINIILHTLPNTLQFFLASREYLLFVQLPRSDPVHVCVAFFRHISQSRAHAYSHFYLFYPSIIENGFVFQFKLMG